MKKGWIVLGRQGVGVVVVNMITRFNLQWKQWTVNQILQKTKGELNDRLKFSPRARKNKRRQIWWIVSTICHVYEESYERRVGQTWEHVCNGAVGRTEPHLQCEFHWEGECVCLCASPLPPALGVGRGPCSGDRHPLMPRRPGSWDLQTQVWILVLMWTT